MIVSIIQSNRPQLWSILMQYPKYGKMSQSIAPYCAALRWGNNVRRISALRLYHVRQEVRVNRGDWFRGPKRRIKSYSQDYRRGFLPAAQPAAGVQAAFHHHHHQLGAKSQKKDLKPGSWWLPLSLQREMARPATWNSSLSLPSSQNETRYFNELAVPWPLHVNLWFDWWFDCNH